MPAPENVSTDHGSLLEADAWAITWRSEEGFALLCPKMEDHVPVAPEALLLTAAFIRLDQDADFRRELADWLEQRKPV